MLHVAAAASVAAAAVVVGGVAAGTATISVYADMAVQCRLRTEALHSAQAGMGKIFGFLIVIFERYVQERE